MKILWKWKYTLLVNYVPIIIQLYRSESWSTMNNIDGNQVHLPGTPIPTHSYFDAILVGLKYFWFFWVSEKHLQITMFLLYILFWNPFKLCLVYSVIILLLFLNLPKISSQYKESKLVCLCLKKIVEKIDGWRHYKVYQRKT